MTNASRTASRGLLMVVAALIAAPGCGDGPICPSEVVVAIQSPASGATFTAADDTGADPGIQLDVAVMSNLRESASLTLTVTDSSGAVASYDASAADDGSATFAGVTLPAGALTLSVTAASDCGTASDQAQITVVTEGDCLLSIDEGPIENEYYDPIPVLNTTNDSDLGLPNFQAHASVVTAPGFDVQVYVLDVEAGSEASLGSVSSGESGTAAFEFTLAQGLQAVRATCNGPGVSEASATHTVVVDTEAPTCALTRPSQGTAVTPNFDEDGDAENGVQFVWTGTADGGEADDVEGEASTFFRGAQQFEGTAIAGDGTATTVAAAEFTSPGTFPARFETQDHAGNLCSAGFDVPVFIDGCEVVIESPTTLVTTDSDDSDANGIQTDVVAQIGDDCIGNTAVASCGMGDVTVTVAADGRAVFEDVTLSDVASSQGQTTCTVVVTNVDDFTTSDSATVDWDSEAPGAALLFVDPNTLSCGDTITLTDGGDVDGDLVNGYQIDVNVVAPLATSRAIELTNAGTCAGTCVINQTSPGATVRVTLDPGDNDVRAVGTDGAGNVGRSAPCNVTLADIAVGFSPPIDDGTAGLDDGTVAGNVLSLPICGTTSEPTATVTVSVDGGATLATVVDGAGAWCTTTEASLTEGTHAVIATASLGERIGTGALNLVVDLSAPDAPSDLVVTSPDRQALAVSWTGVAGADGYMLRYSTAPFVDFASEGVEVAGVGVVPSALIEGLVPGEEYHVGVGALDEAGNLSAVITDGPFVPTFDATGAILPPDANDGGPGEGFGLRIVGGDFDDDGFADVAVAAPYTAVGGSVYVYFGSAGGIDFSTPDVTINSPAPGSNFGIGMTRIAWGGGAGDDLAIGAPFLNAFNGGVFIFEGATLAGSTTLTTAAADATITTEGTIGNWFAGGGVGWSLAAGDIDAAGNGEDLIVGVPGGGGFEGGVVIVYGGSGAAAIQLSDDTNLAEMDGAAAHWLRNPGPVATYGNLFGATVAYLGDTRAGDGVGDVGVTYFNDTDDGVAGAEPDRAFVVRGRTTTVVGALTPLTLGANDRVLELATADGSTAFGEGFGSIADQTGDGFRDIVVTAFRNGNGRAWIVDGAATSTMAAPTTIVPSTSGYLTQITGAAPRAFATGYANNAEAVGSPDIDGDGIDDLVLAGGFGADVALHVWFGDQIPTGTISSASAHYVVDAPAAFTNVFSGGQPGALSVTWVGDVNGDGLSDICWGDYEASGTSGGVGYETEGRIELLWDDGV